MRNPHVPVKIAVEKKSTSERLAVTIMTPVLQLARVSSKSRADAR
jgi:hypothetical protein